MRISTQIVRFETGCDTDAVSDPIDSLAGNHTVAKLGTACAKKVSCHDLFIMSVFCILYNTDKYHKYQAFPLCVNTFKSTQGMLQIYLHSMVISLNKVLTIYCEVDIHSCSNSINALLFTFTIRTATELSSSCSRIMCICYVSNQILTVYC